MVIAKSEISVRARMLYHKLDDRIKSDRQGDVVVIDVISGEYEIDPDETVAKLRLLERLPNAALWSIPIGRPAASYCLVASAASRPNYVVAANQGQRRCMV